MDAGSKTLDYSTWKKSCLLCSGLPFSCSAFLCLHFPRVMGLQAQMLALPSELSMVLWMRGISTVPEEIWSPHQGQVSGVHVGHVAEGGQVSQVLDQVFQRSAVVSHKERKMCHVTSACLLGQQGSEPALSSPQASAMAQQTPWGRGYTAPASARDGSKHLNSCALGWPGVGHEPKCPQHDGSKGDRRWVEEGVRCCKGS